MRAVMATAASSLFVPESLAPDRVPLFRDELDEIKAFFDRLLEKTFGVAEGVWIGTPVNLNLEHETGELARRMSEIGHPHLVLWGEKDGWIPLADLRSMAEAMPDCRLVTVPGVGHSMNLEQPALYAGYFGAWFGGLASDAELAGHRRAGSLSAQPIAEPPDSIGQERL
jgi:non-heme chloroperoxidase